MFQDGSGKSTGNNLSIQIVAVVRVARDLGKLPALDPTDTVSALHLSMTIN